VGKLWSVLCCILVLAAGGASADTRAHRYTETHGSSTQPIDYSVEPEGDGFKVTAIDTDSTNLVHWSPTAGTVTWHWKDTVRNTELDAERIGDTIRVRGTIAGHAVSREVKVDAAPWYQIFGPVPEQLLPGLQGQREFWVLNTDDAVGHKMQVRRAGTERITLNGSGVDAMKLHFSPAGALSPFWGADYWFRASDSLYIYSRLPENGGLTVTTIVEPVP
jgi:hypothetical protein